MVFRPETAKHAYRIVQSRYPPFDGSGTPPLGQSLGQPRTLGGAWSAETYALAVLENLVHWQTTALPPSLVCVRVTIPAGLLQERMDDFSSAALTTRRFPFHTRTRRSVVRPRKDVGALGAFSGIALRIQLAVQSTASRLFPHCGGTANIRLCGLAPEGRPKSIGFSGTAHLAQRGAPKPKLSNEERRGRTLRLQPTDKRLAAAPGVLKWGPQSGLRQ